MKRFWKLFRADKLLPIEPLKVPGDAVLPPVRSMVMPNGKVVRVMREDVFQQAIRPQKHRAA